jgi:hypothetical protein
MDLNTALYGLHTRGIRWTTLRPRILPCDVCHWEPPHYRRDIPHPRLQSVLALTFVPRVHDRGK